VHGEGGPEEAAVEAAEEEELAGLEDEESLPPRLLELAARFVCALGVGRKEGRFDVIWQ